MQNIQFIRAVDKVGGANKMAQALGVSIQAIYFWQAGKRKLPHEHGASIDDLTNGEVTRQDLWPDTWHRIWPELAVDSEPKHPPALDGQALGATAAQGV